SILRARRVAVAGDKQQLPPTTFFADGSNEDEDADESLMSEGFESLLDQMSSFLPTQMLEWHYRSLDEKLIAFSNHHIYNDRLVTFPGPGGRVPPVSHVLVPNVLGEDGQEESATPEVRRVVELVLQHAKDHPDESLGVIAMGIKHANKVEAALDQALKV
ncbi:DNA helicase, partial [mine drainage metagenome]